MRRMTIFKKSRLFPRAAAPAVKIILPLAILLLAIGCRPEQSAPPQPAEPAGAQPAAAAAPRELPPTPVLKPSIRLDRTLLPTPTLHAKLFPVQYPTSAATDLPPDEAREVSQTTVDPVMVEATATTVPLVPCDERMPGGDLHAIVSTTYGISGDYVPEDLVLLTEHLPYSVSVGYPSEVRQVVLQPLVEMTNDMIAAGLQPQVLSGYRSFAAQAIAWDKWNRLYPERAHIISARPGYSEHQLGTVVDFGSPELPGLVGQPGIQFHTDFIKTSEGAWLAENAHKYGFTLSFTLQAFETTGFYYEPWHYRYVGKSMAAQLYEQQLTLTEYRLAHEPPPCIP